MIESPIMLDGYSKAKNKNQFAIDQVIHPLFIEQKRNFFVKNKGGDDDDYMWIDMNDENIKLSFAKRVTQKFRDKLNSTRKKQRKLNPDKPQRENSGHLHPSSPKKRKQDESTLSLVDAEKFPIQGDDLPMISVDFDSFLSSDEVCEPPPESNVKSYQDLDEVLNSTYNKIETNQDFDLSLNSLLSKVEKILFPVHSDDLSMISVDEFSTGKDM